MDKENKRCSAGKREMNRGNVRKGRKRKIQIYICTDHHAKGKNMQVRERKTERESARVNLRTARESKRNSEKG